MPEDQQQLSLTLTWSPFEKAQLIYVLDNDVEVDVEGVSGFGQLAVTWNSAPAPLHLIAWAVAFPGKKLQRLAARATINKGEPDLLATSDSSRNLWKGYGAIP